MMFASISLLFVVSIVGLVSTVDILPWENYLQLGSIDKPLGLILNQSSLAHRHFLIGYLCLHSFLYDTAQEAFQLALETDPTLVEAHIGRLLGHKQALWYETDTFGALQSWNDTWSLLDSYNVTLTPLQSSYLTTVYQWFSFPKTADGEMAFLDSILNLTREFPSEIDGQTWLGLAYLNKAQHEGYTLKMMEPPALLTARQILQAVLVHQPSHPGCLHYLIHAFDVSRVEAAFQAVPYASKYGQVAQTASHAQHMPSHIWIHLGAWPLAESANAKSVEVSLLLCVIKQLQINVTQIVLNETSPETLLSVLLTHLNDRQAESLVYCDRDNRVHSQEWLVYFYLQSGRYKMCLDVLADLIHSNNVFPSDAFYLPYIYVSRAHIVSNVFFWVMNDKEKNQKIFARSMNKVLVQMDSNPIQILDDNTTTGSYLKWNEAAGRFAECIRLLVIDDNQMNSTTTAIDYQLSRMTHLLSIIKSKTSSTSIRISLMVSQVNAIRWCLNNSFQKCLTDLENATRVESFLGNQYNRPYILEIRCAELFAFYLLIIHRYHSTVASTYLLNNSIIAVSDFPSYALRLYTVENETDPHRSVNLLGMARAYAQMGETDQANQLYGKVLREWSHATFSLDIDRLVIEEANEYFLKTNINQTKNVAADIPRILFIFLCIFLFVNK